MSDFTEADRAMLKEILDTLRLMSNPSWMAETVDLENLPELQRPGRISVVSDGRANWRRQSPPPGIMMPAEPEGGRSE